MEVLFFVAHHHLPYKEYPLCQLYFCWKLSRLDSLDFIFERHQEDQLFVFQSCPWMKHFPLVCIRSHSIYLASDSSIFVIVSKIDLLLQMLFSNFYHAYPSPLFSFPSSVFINCYSKTNTYANILHFQGFFRLLAIWMLPCFLLKTAREVVRVSYAGDVPWWQSVVILLALVISWTYSMIIYLSGSSLFNLVCNLQVIHFENYGKLLERDLDVSEYIEEHIRLVHYLSKISHRFRIFLLLEFLAVTATQILSLLETTSNTGIINFINGGDFAVSPCYLFVF